MPENEQEKSERAPDGKMSGKEIGAATPFLKKLDNYWYHYKWRTIIALFVLIAVIICTVQMCGKKKYDLEVMYAGPYVFKSDGQAAADIESAVEGCVTGEEKISVNLVSYWVDEELNAQAGADLAFMRSNSLSNEKAFRDEIVAGNVSIYLLSPYLFHMADDEGAFVDLTGYLPEWAGNGAQIFARNEDNKLNRRGILVKKTPFGTLPGISSLPDDTILCLRNVSSIGSIFGLRKAEDRFAECEEIFRAIMNYTKEDN